MIQKHGKKWKKVFIFLSAFLLLNIGLFTQDLQNDTIYQVLTDRFYDGDLTNNATGNAFKYEMIEEIDMHYMKGGDWQGLIDKLDYIQNLGFSAIWISPIADPQLWRMPAPDGSQFPAAYHGYNAHDPNRANRYFGNIDPDLSKQKLKGLVDAAHLKGIKVILDIVPNHLGDFMLEELGWRYPTSADFPTVEVGTQFEPVAPWNNLNWYHRVGNADFGYADSLPIDDRILYLENHDLGNLDDIEYDNIDAKTAIFDSISGWFSYLGADAARVDAAKSMFPATVGELEDYLGVSTFGENFDGDVDYIARYVGTDAEWGMLDFPLFFAIVSNFGHVEPFNNAGGVADVLSQDYKYGGYANHMVTFIDNHDRNRFMAETLGNPQKLRNALVFLFTVRGVPCVFYGTETEKGNHNDIYLSGAIKDSWNRWPMVEKDAGGAVVVDHFNDVTATKTLLPQLNNLRKTYEALRNGSQREMWQDPTVYAFSRRMDTGVNEGREIIAVFTNSDLAQTRTIPIRAESSIAPATRLVNVFNPLDVITVSAAGDITVTVEPQSWKVYAYTGWDQVYLRGTPNGWGTDLPMSKNASGLWEIVVTFGSAPDERFKFDIYGDWSLNYGDNEPDGLADQNGADIYITQGAGSYTITLNELTKAYSVTKEGFVSTYPQIYFRGTPNGWGVTGMSLVADYTWQIQVTFGSAADERFKFDVYGDWSLNYGDNEPDGLADQNGADIYITQGAGSYTITLNDLTKAYSVTKEGFVSTYPQIYFRGTPNGWGVTGMSLVADYTWQIQVTFGSAPDERFKFDVYGDWSLNFGDNEPDGLADQNGADIYITQGAGNYTIDFNDQSKLYTVALN